MPVEILLVAIVKEIRKKSYRSLKKVALFFELFSLFFYIMHVFSKFVNTKR